jgi:hypothetical protein
VTDGLKRLDVSNAAPLRTLTEPLEMLKHIRATAIAGTYALLDFHARSSTSAHGGRSRSRIGIRDARLWRTWRDSGCATTRRLRCQWRRSAHAPYPAVLYESSDERARRSPTRP